MVIKNTARAELQTTILMHCISLLLQLKHSNLIKYQQ